MKIVRNVSGLRVLPRVDAEARVEASTLVAQARRDADAIVAAARAEAAAVRESARSEGAAAGAVEAAAWLAKARIDAERTAAQHAESVSSLAVEVVRKVLGREATSGPEVLRDVASLALGRVRRARRLLLKVNPADLATAEQHVRAWLPAGMEPEGLGIESDPSIERGGVVVDSDVGRIDARLDRQLDAIARALRTAG